MASSTDKRVSIRRRKHDCERKLEGGGWWGEGSGGALISIKHIQFRGRADRRAFLLAEAGSCVSHQSPNVFKYLHCRPVSGCMC